MRSTPSESRTPPVRPRVHVLAGARAMTPWLFGIAPYGLVIGISAAKSGIPTLAGWLTGPVILAGSAQVATIQLLHEGAAPVVVVAAALAVNLRLVLYSATMARYWSGWSPWWQALAAYALVDPTLAVGVDGYERSADRAEGHLRYLGAASLLWFVWIAAITVGATAGRALPSGLHLEFVIPLFLLGEAAQRLRGPAVRRGVGVAVAVALVSVVVPFQLGVLVAIACGTATALGTKEAP